jgi:hypothetical protein
MTWLKNHLRDKFLAGALAAVPVVVVVWAPCWSSSTPGHWPSRSAWR